MTLQFLAALSLIVFVHESGHFLAARAFGIRVKKFYLFFDAFGKSLLRFRHRGTTFGLGWLPLGGYVALAGANGGAEDDEDVPEHERYDGRPVWQRVVVMSSGVLMNLLFALLTYSSLSLIYGRTPIAGIGNGSVVLPGKLGRDAGLKAGDQVRSVDEAPVIYEDELFSTRLLRGNTILTVVRKQGNDRVHLHIAVAPRTMQLIAEKGFNQFYSVRAGLQLDSVLTNIELSRNEGLKGSRLIAINNDPVRSLADLSISLKTDKKRELYLTVIRNGRTSILPAHRDKDGHLAFSLNDRTPVIPPMNIGRSLRAGATRTWHAVAVNAQGFGQLINGEVRPGDAMFGPLRLATLFGRHYDGRRFWELMAVMSLAIAVFNLLPLLPLDGGAIGLLVWEAVFKRPVSLPVMQILQLTGMLLILLLTLFVFFNDIRTFI